MRKFKLKFSYFIFEKIKESAISQKLQKIEHSYLGARFATPESTLTAPNFRVRNSTKFERT